MGPREIPVYLEVGAKRTFAGALEWPGWCRSGRDEASALAAMLEAGPRYARALRGTRLGFEAPADLSSFSVRQRLKGDATTDFGAPGAEPRDDRAPVDEADLSRFEGLLRAGWRALDRASQAAAGKELRKGPRGGGRSLDAILRHVLEAEVGYLAALGWKASREGEADAVRGAIRDGLGASARGEIPATGPRGGKRWSPRYFVRRTVWHALDHAWEIEDRAG